jgi:hypothetical protein
MERLYNEQRARADDLQVQVQSARARVTELEEQCSTLQVRLRCAGCCKRRPVRRCGRTQQMTAETRSGAET